MVIYYDPLSRLYHIITAPINYSSVLHPRHTFQKLATFFCRRFLLRVSCISGTGFVRYQKPAPVRTLFYSKPESGVHVTEMMNHDWSMIIAYVLMCFLVLI